MYAVCHLSQKKKSSKNSMKALTYMPMLSVCKLFTSIIAPYSGGLMCMRWEYNIECWLNDCRYLYYNAAWIPNTISYIRSLFVRKSLHTIKVSRWCSLPPVVIKGEKELVSCNMYKNSKKEHTTVQLQRTLVFPHVIFWYLNISTSVIWCYTEGNYRHSVSFR